MGIFKSREEKDLERQIRVKQNIAKIKRDISDCDKRAKEFIQFARRAKQVGDAQSLASAKSGLKQTMIAKRLRERQLLHLQIAMTIRDQADADVSFAKAMKEVSAAITELCKSVNMTQIQLEYERAMGQSEMLKDRMEQFISDASATVQERETGAEEIVRDEEIDKLIEEEAVRAESTELDRQIQESLREIEGKLGEKEKPEK